MIQVNEVNWQEIRRDTDNSEGPDNDRECLSDVSTISQEKRILSMAGKVVLTPTRSS
jgi:hypothetical protein